MSPSVKGPFSFNLKTTDGSARRGEVVTPHGSFQTPAFMPVATTGAMKALYWDDMLEMGAEIVLGNTYHLYLRPGHELIERYGGLAEFTGWRRPTLTDSGGYQVFSLKEINKITDAGVEFQSHLDGSRHMFTPEKVMNIQHALGADIVMAFDQCVPYPADEQLAAVGVRRTHQWARQCLEQHNKLNATREEPLALFGIVQGSMYPKLREESARQIVDLDFPGNAIGGLSVGEPKDLMEEMVGHAIQHLPDEKPRYLMGVGYPEDLLMAIGQGVDMFDCVAPTRNARTGQIFTSEGLMAYRNAEYADDDRPLDPNCECRVCRTHTRAYLRHLYNQHEIAALMLSSYHSSFFLQQMMRDSRQAIEHGRFDQYRQEFLARYFGSGT